MKQQSSNFALTKHSKARQTRYFSGALFTLLFAALFTDAHAQGLYTGATFDSLVHATTATTPVTHAKGAESVSLSGGATYTLPIAIAPGTGGMQPNLAVTYNSQSGVSNMGMGWSLAAGSAISRTNKTVAQDGAASAPALANTDALSFDGQRMVLLTGNYGAINSVYTTENETYTRITLLGGDLNNTAAYFSVLTKNGMRIEYGSANFAAFKSGTATSANLLWRINKTTDAFGNYMTYTYQDGVAGGGSSYLTQIDYTGNVAASLATYNKVVFTYAARTIDATTGCMIGTAIKNDKKLMTITAFAEGAEFRKYDFTYGSLPVAAATAPSIPRTTEFITAITESNVTTGTTYVAQNPIYFKYGDVPAAIASNNLLVETVSSDPAGTNTLGLQKQPGTTPDNSGILGYKYMSGDYDGDGYTDLLEIRLARGFDEYANPCYKDWDGTYYRFKEPSYDSIKVLRNNRPESDMSSTANPTNKYTPKFTAPYGAINLEYYGESSSPNGCDFPLFPWTYASHIYSEIVAANVDINGDGKDDVVTSRFKHTKKYGVHSELFSGELLELIGIDTYTNLDGTPVHNYYSLGNDPGFVVRKWLSDYRTGNTLKYYPVCIADDRIVQVGDFDGDNRADIVIGKYVDESNTQLYVLFPSKSPTYCGATSVVTNAGRDMSDIKVFDINGDGINEISVGGREVSFGVAVGNTIPISTIVRNYGIQPIYADFNGDGKSDMLYENKKIRYSIGTDFSSEVLLPTAQNTLSTFNMYNQLITADFNADGKADIMYSTKSGNSYRLGFYFSTGNGFTQTYRDVNADESASLYWDNGTNLGYRPELMGLGDFNADGQPDFLSRNTIGDASNPSPKAAILYVLPNQRHHLLHKVKDGLDNVTEFQYRGLAQPLRTNQNFRLAGSANGGTSTVPPTPTPITPEPPKSESVSTVDLPSVLQSPTTALLQNLPSSIATVANNYRVLAGNPLNGTNGLSPTPPTPPLPPTPSTPPALSVQSTAYPLQSRVRAMTVVMRMTVPSGSSNSGEPTRSILYDYGLPVMNIQGRGFFGFQYMITRDFITQIESKSQTTYNAYGAPLWQATYTKRNNGTVAAPNYIWYSRGTQLFDIAEDATAPLRYVVRPSWTNDTNYVNKSYTRIARGYDVYTKNNVDRTLTKVYNITPTGTAGGYDVTIGAYEMSSEIVNYNNYVPAIKQTGLTNAIPALPTEVVSRKKLGIVDGEILKTSYDYENDPIDGTPEDIKGRVRKVTTQSSGSGIANIKNLRYDSFGNLVFESVGYYISENDFANRPSTRYKYEAKGRFATHTAGTLSLQTQSDLSLLTYQVSKADYTGIAAARFGLPASTTDVAGLQTNYTYDAIGRATQTVQNVGKANALTTTNAFTWVGPNLVPPADAGTVMYAIANTEKAASPIINCSAETITYVDALERKRLTTTTNLQGATVYTGIATFDNQGRTLTQTAPYFANESSTATNTLNTYNDFSGTEIAALNQLKTIMERKGSIDIIETAFAYATAMSGTTVTVTKTDKYTTDGTMPTQITSKTSNQLGQTTSTTDAGGTMQYTYGEWGVVQTSYGVQAIMKVDYDGFGRQTSLWDKNVNPSMSNKTEYTYNNYGELASQKDTKGNKYEMTYDAAGRMLTKTLTAVITGTIGSVGDNTGSAMNETTVYAYSPVANTATAVTGINQLVSETLQNHPTSPTATIHKKVYEYNALQQNTKVTETIGAEVFTTNYYYDACSRNMTTEYPKGASTTMPKMVINRIYNANGYLDKVNRVSDVTPNPTVLQTLFTAGAKNALGKTTAYTLNGTTNPITITREFDELGLPKTYKAGTPAAPAFYQDLSFKFETSAKNLIQRADALVNKSETFTFDILDRLTSNTVHPTATPGSIPPTNTTSFANNGNITAKSDIGYYKYGTDLINDRPNALIGLNVPGSRLDIIEWRNRKQQILYTAFEQPAIIKEFTTAAANAPFNQLNYTYGTHENRVKSVEFNSATPTATTTRYYLGSYERLDIGAKSKRHIYYLGAGAIITYHENTETTPPTDANAYKTYYALTDHLGSIVKVIDANGTSGALSVAAEYNYDAWGRKRNAIYAAATTTPVAAEILAWSYPALGVAPTGDGLPWLTRGYTGHEHLRTFGLINMNGRMYDPALGQMLSPDNFAGLDGTTQSFNRYSYVMNNPLKYTDPSGEWAQIAIGAVLGGYSGGVTMNNGEINPLKWNWSDSNTWRGVVGGAVIGALSGGVSTAISTSGWFLSSTLGMVAGSSISSLGMNILTGGKSDIEVNFGVASYNITRNEFGYLGKSGNSTIENIGYGLGLLGNLADIGGKKGNLKLNTEKADVINHSAILTKDGKPLISIGPNGQYIGGDPYSKEGLIRGTKHYGKLSAGLSPATNTYAIHGVNMDIKNVNVDAIQRYSNGLNTLTRNKVLPYSFLYSSCSTHTGLALTMSGIPALFIHPYTVQASVYLWNVGVTPALIQNSHIFQSIK
jgi:RHS repeat-associated protein